MLKAFEPDLSLAPTQRARASPVAVRDAAKRSEQTSTQALRAQFVRATTRCGDCGKPRAVFCKVSWKSLEQQCGGSGAAEDVSDISKRTLSSDADTDSDSEVAGGAAEVADQHASDSDASGAQVAAPPPPPRVAAARAPGARTTRQQSRLASEIDASVAPAQDGAGVEASGVVVHAAEVDASAQTGAAPDAEAEAAAGILSSRSARAASGRQSTVAKKQGRLHAPGTYVYDQVEAACQNEQYTSGAVLMPAGHTLEAHVYCNEALTCVAPGESMLYGMSGSALTLPLVDFSKGLWSIFGAVEVPSDARKEQKCSGNVIRLLDAYPLCDTCADHGFAAVCLRKAKAQSRQNMTELKRARVQRTVGASGSGGSGSVDEGL